MHIFCSYSVAHVQTEHLVHMYLKVKVDLVNHNMKQSHIKDYTKPAALVLPKYCLMGNYRGRKLSQISPFCAYQ